MIKDIKQSKNKAQEKIWKWNHQVIVISGWLGYGKYYFFLLFFTFPKYFCRVQATFTLTNPIRYSFQYSLGKCSKTQKDWKNLESEFLQAEKLRICTKNIYMLHPPRIYNECLLFSLCHIWIIALAIPQSILLYWRISK